MTTNISLDQLEGAVLARISAHRTRRRERESLPAGVVLTVCALVAGLSVGLVHGHHGSVVGRGSESVVLADDASLAPSSLLTSGP